MVFVAKRVALAIIVLFVVTLLSFVLGVLLVYLFAVSFHVFPATGWTPLTQDLGDNLKHAILPSLTLALGSLAVYMRVLRTDMIATLREDFITTARAKGMPTSHILVRHALRPSTFALITVAGINLGTLISGAFIVEFIFQAPGIGLLTL